MLRTRLLCLATVALALSASTARADEVWLRNGNQLTGTVKRMTEGSLVFETTWGGTIKIGWKEVANLKTDAQLPLLLDDHSTLMGRVEPGEEGLVGVKTQKLQGHIRLHDLAAINPPSRPPVVFHGFIRAGGTVTDGNTRTREATAAGEVVARSRSLRLLLRGKWNYGEDRKAGQLYKRNTLAEIKMDFFLLPKLFLYTNALFMSDAFQDLDLRSALGGGAGYQWVETNRVKFFTEGGLSYVVDSRGDGNDTQALSIRVAWKLNWAITKTVDFVHSGELFPSIEEQKDVFFNTSTGFKFTIFAGFFASAQIDFRYDNTPSGSAGRRDFTYILSLGYKF